MIPKNITRRHILKAIELIEKEGIPEERVSRKFLLEFGGKEYPPKYLISLANKYTNGKQLYPDEFSGGYESNNFLRSLGFTIRQFKDSNNSKKPQRGHYKEYMPVKYYHDERCPKCKAIVYAMLDKIDKKAERGHKFKIGAHPETLRSTSYYKSLKDIYEALGRYRGFKEFVKANTLPNCDFFLSNHGIVVEYDESQHFTLPRKLTLENYPEGLKLGFDKKKWIRLCEIVNSRNNDPPYRDEQRAWYDTLRDFLPAIAGLKPTIRLYSKDFKWCSLNPDKPSDVKKFKRIIKGTLIEEMKVGIKGTANPSIGRIIIVEHWDGKPKNAKKLLNEIHKKWPKDKKINFLITCGGFIQFEWPKSMSWEEIGDNKDPNRKAVNTLIAEAEKCARDVLNGGLSEKLREMTDYITLGIDSYKEQISKAQVNIRKPHIETVFLVDLKTNKFYWTGKTYPTVGQQHGLVRITDMKTHFANLSGIGKVMILGCHDLTMFNNRNMDKTGTWRKEIKRGFRRLTTKENPVIVLHHPHTTVTTGTWRNSWSTINKMLPSVKEFAGAGRYFEPDRRKSEYDPITKVLETTKKGNVIDFIVTPSSTSRR